MKTVLGIGVAVVLLVVALVLEALTDSSLAAFLVFAVGIVLLVVRYERVGRAH